MFIRGLMLTFFALNLAFAQAPKGTLDTTFPVLPTADLASPGAIVAEGKVFLMGGHLGNQHHYEPENFTNVCWSMDLTKKQWTPLAAKNDPSLNPAMAYHKGQIYSFGGFAYSDNPELDWAWTSLDTVEKYDIKTDTWTKLAVKMPRKRSNSVSAQLGNKVYFMAGWNSEDGSMSTKIDVFNLETETFSTMTGEMPAPRRRAAIGWPVEGATTEEDHILVVGGMGNFDGNTLPLLTQIEAYYPNKPAGQQWQAWGDLKYPNTNSNFALVNGQAFVFGGQVTTSVFTNSVIKYDRATNVWSDTGLELLSPRGFSKVIPVSDSEVLILGGYVKVDAVDPLTGAKNASPVDHVELFSLK